MNFTFIIWIVVEIYIMIMIYKFDKEYERKLTDYKNGIECEAEIIAFKDLKEVRIGMDETIMMVKPLYECTIDKKKIKIKGPAYYPVNDLNVGGKVDGIFNIDKEMFLCIKDVTILKMQLKRGVILVQVFLIIMVIISFFF